MAATAYAHWAQPIGKDGGNNGVNVPEKVSVLVTSVRAYVVPKLSKVRLLAQPTSPCATDTSSEACLMKALMSTLCAGSPGRVGKDPVGGSDSLPRGLPTLHHFRHRFVCPVYAWLSNKIDVSSFLCVQQTIQRKFSLIIYSRSGSFCAATKKGAPSFNVRAHKAVQE